MTKSPPRANDPDIRQRHVVIEPSLPVRTRLDCLFSFLANDTGSIPDWRGGSPPDPDTLLIETERVRSVFHHAPLTLVVTITNALLTVFVLEPLTEPRLLSTWMALIVAVSAGRWAVRQAFFRRWLEGAQSLPWALFSVGGSLATGALWGVGVIVLCPPVEMYQVFLAFVVGGMCAGATAANSAHLPTVLAFILPASLPLAGSFLAGGSRPQVVSAVMVVIFSSALSMVSVRAHRTFGERIRLQLTLQRQQRALSETNEQLLELMAERQKIEATLQQAQKMEAIGQLTGGIAHDFNNLLQVVIGNMELIRRLSDCDPRIIRSAAAATLAAERGARLTGSLLAFARRQTLRAEKLNVNTELTAFQPILLQALGGSVPCEFVYKADLPMCYVDLAHLQSAILNLVINARDAMPEGGQLSITTGVAMLSEDDLLQNPDANAGNFVTVSVRDSGTGMSEETMAKVFEPFFTTKETGKGSGLGLSQVFGFVRQSGGHIRLWSKPGAGTCVTIFLPAADQAIAAPAGPP